MECGMNWIKLLIGGGAMFVAYCIALAWTGYKPDGKPFIDELAEVMVSMGSVLALTALFVAGLYMVFSVFHG